MAAEACLARVLDTADKEYIEGNMLSKVLIDSMGADYLPAGKWVAGLCELEVVKVGFQRRYLSELAEYTETVSDAKILVACVLAYNCLYNRYPKQSTQER